MPAPKKTKEPESFDDRLRQLESIVHALEDGELDLEPAIERYKEGVALLKDCSKVLSGYRKQVEELTAAEDGDAIVPYEGDPDVDSDGDLH